jgi:predicted dehydrogenase
MKRRYRPLQASDVVDRQRRRLLGVAGTSLLFGGLMTAGSEKAGAASGLRLRWGIVGTGGIANRVAPMLKQAPSAVLAAVSSRRMSTAEEFAKEHGADRAFDDWTEMLEWEGIDAVYIATPTSVREEISLAAAGRRKHVLAEKPFASLASVQRITRACRENDLAFMDGTHFVHHPRTQALRDATSSSIGPPWSLDSAFQFSIPDRTNIRFDRMLEPMGAIGDAGWYNMRAIVEYLEPDIPLAGTECYSRRDAETNAVISAGGILRFADGANSTFNCGFDSGALVMDLRLTGADGVIFMDDFVLTQEPGTATYVVRKGGFDPGRRVDVPSPLPVAALMFQDFARAVADPAGRERWMQASERTQGLLDAVWNAALGNDDPSCDE